MKKKIKEILNASMMFASLTYLGQNSYLLEWLANRYFCFIWIPIVFFWIIKQDILARWLTFGTFSGLIVGQIMEDMKWSLYGSDYQPAHSSYWGVGMWFTIIVITFGFGVIQTWIKLKKKQKSQSPT